MRMKLIVVVLAGALAGCASTKLPPAVPVVMRYPELDSALAAPCEIPAAPAAADYDAWQAWIEGPMIRAFSDCAIRHRETVAAWPRNPN